MTFAEKIDQYLNWYASEDQKWYEIPVKIVLSIPTSIFVMIYAVVEESEWGDMR